MPVPSNRRAQAVAHMESGAKALAESAIAAARASLQAAVAMEPSWAEPRYRLARVHLAAGDRDLAEQSLRAAREADPQHAPSTHMLGTMLCDREAFVEALPLLREAAALQPDQAEFQRDLGVLQLFVGDIAAARINLHRALDLDPLVKDILPTLVRMTRMDSGGAEAERLFDLDHFGARPAASTNCRPPNRSGSFIRSARRWRTVATMTAPSMPSPRPTPCTAGTVAYR